MSFTRFTGERGGTITLEAIFKKDGVLADPYSSGVMTVDILDETGTTYVNGNYFGSPSPINLSGLVPTRMSAGVYNYDFVTIPTMTIGTYIDRWNDIQYSSGSDVVSGVFSFTIRYNTEDLSDWDVLPG
jgi:hypothetical protein